MPESTPEQVLNDLKKGTYSPVYFLQGEENFYIDKISDFIEENALDEMSKGFNQIILYGKDIDVSAVITNARRFPMMSERQVLIIKEAQEIKDLNNDEPSKMLAEYLQNPVPSTILVFAHKNKLIDGRKALGKALKKNAVFIQTKALYENQVPQWMSAYVSDIGYKIKPKAQLMLIEAVGTSLSKLSNEIDKIIINFKEKGVEITEEHVQKFVGVSKDYNIFELQGAFARKDVLKANKIITYFEKNSKDNPLQMLVPSLYTYFSKILLLYSLKEKSEKAAASLLGIHPFIVKEYLLAQKNYPLAKLYHIISDLRHADMQVKGIQYTGASDGQILKELTFKILH